MNFNQTQLIHQNLNQIYTISETVLIELKRKLKGSSFKLINCSKNYIKIDSKFELQKYPIPIIEVESFGDICFNLNKVIIEIFKNVSDVNKIDIPQLIKRLPEVEIYGGKDCLLDFYPGNKASDVLIDINRSNEKTIGFSFNLSYRLINNDEFNDLLLKTLQYLMNFF